jgi:UDP-2,3-diacylglucosamine hydrolase
MHLANNKKYILPRSAFWCANSSISLPREKRFVAWLDEVKGMKLFSSGGFI